MTTLFAYTDVDGDLLAAFTADIPDVGEGINIRTTEDGCSLPNEDAVELALTILREVVGKVYESPEELAAEVDRLRRENAALQQVATRAEKDVATLTRDRDQALEESTAIAARIFADEQKCQAAITEDPTNAWMNGRLVGLQRARDIATEVAPPLPSSEPATWPEDDDQHGCGDHCPCDGTSSATAPRDLTTRVEALEADNATRKELWNGLVGSVRRVTTRAHLAHSRGESNSALISEATETFANHHQRLSDLEELTASLSSLVEGHSHDISQAQAALRGLGKRLAALEPPQ